MLFRSQQPALPPRASPDCIPTTPNPAYPTQIGSPLPENNTPMFLWPKPSPGTSVLEFGTNSAPLPHPPRITHRTPPRPRVLVSIWERRRRRCRHCPNTNGASPHPCPNLHLPTPNPRRMMHTRKRMAHAVQNEGGIVIVMPVTRQWMRHRPAFPNPAHNWPMSARMRNPCPGGSVLGRV